MHDIDTQVFLWIINAWFGKGWADIFAASM